MTTPSTESTANQDAPLTHPPREARNHHIGPPTNPRRITRLTTNYDLVGLVDMGAGRRSQAADASKRLYVGRTDWGAKCLAPRAKRTAMGRDPDLGSVSHILGTEAEATSRLTSLMSDVTLTACSSPSAGNRLHRR